MALAAGPPWRLNLPLMAGPFPLRDGLAEIATEPVMGEVTAVAFDGRDQALHHPRLVKDRDPAEVAPSVTELDRRGHYICGFGGPGDGYEGPATEHCLAVAANGAIWIGAMIATPDMATT